MSKKEKIKKDQLDLGSNDPDPTDLPEIKLDGEPDPNMRGFHQDKPQSQSVGHTVIEDLAQEVPDRPIHLGPPDDDAVAEEAARLERAARETEQEFEDLERGMAHVPNITFGAEGEKPAAQPPRKRKLPPPPELTDEDGNMEKRH